MIEQQTILSIYKILKTDEPSIIRGAIGADIEEVKKALAKDPACINEVDEHIGVTALHIACFDGNYPLVDFLCDQPGVDISIRDKFGRTPYLASMALDREDITERLFRDTDQQLDRKQHLDDQTPQAENVTHFRPKPPSP